MGIFELFSQGHLYIDIRRGIFSIPIIRIKSTNIFSMYLQSRVPRNFHWKDNYRFNIELHCFHLCVYQIRSQTLAAICRNIGIRDVFRIVSARETTYTSVYHPIHYSDVIMSAMASQITSLTIIYSTVYSGADQENTSKLCVTGLLWGIHWWPVNSPHKGPVTQKMFPFDDVIMSVIFYSARRLC